jgi:hypothetical protein
VKNPDSDKIVSRLQPQKFWVEHNKGEVREDLAIVSLEKWKKVRSIMAKSDEVHKQTKSKIQTMRASRVMGARSENLLSGILFCHECASQMLQITGRNGGYFGCYLHHRKDPKSCTNNRLISKKKLEQKLIPHVRRTLLDESHLQTATTRLNQMVKLRLQQAPSAIEKLSKQRDTLKKEISNLVRFVEVGGDFSPTIVENLKQKEFEHSNLGERIHAYRSVSEEKVFVTPFVLKSHFESLDKLFETDHIRANLALRKMLPQGLTCKPNIASLKKNHNQNNSLWTIQGTIAVGPGYGGFSGLENGGIEPASDSKL